MDDFVKEYKLETLDEISDHLDKLQDLLLGSENKQMTIDDMNQIFRIFHSIKGNAKSADFTSISSIAHKVEDILLKVKDGEKALNQEIIQIFYSFQENVSDAVESLKKDLNVVLNFNALENDIENLDNNNDKEVDPSKMNFLVVDDDNDIVELLSTYLGSHFECNILKASNGIEAYQLCKELEFDFILTDFNMPSMNGGEFIKSLRESQLPSNETPIIMLTAYTPLLNADQKVWEDVFFMEKPMLYSKLSYIVKCCLKLKKAAS